MMMRLSRKQKKRKWNVVVFAFSFLAVLVLGSQLVLLRYVPVIAEDTTGWVSSYFYSSSSSSSSLDRDPPNTNTKTAPLGHSLVHCVGDNFLPKTAWMYRSCQYRNLCWDGIEWTLAFPSTPLSSPPTSNEHDYPDDDNAYNDFWSSGFSRTSSSHQEDYLTVSLLGTKPFWVRKNKNAWHPKVVLLSDQNKPSNDTAITTRNRIEFDRLIARSNEQRQQQQYVVPIMIPPSSSSRTTMSLLMETLLPLYNLLAMFGWQEESVSVHVLNQEEEEQEQPQQECHHRGKTMNCSDSLHLEDWMGYQRLRFDDDGNNKQKRTTPFCAKYGAAGMGMLTANGLSKRGHRKKDYTTQSIRNSGRGPLFWKFTRHVLRRLGISVSSSSKEEDPKQPTMVHLALPSQNASPKPHSNIWLFLSQGLKASLETKTIDIKLRSIGHTMEHQTTATQEDAIRAAANSDVWIAPADETYTWPAMFMRRGSTLVLLYNDTQHIEGDNTKPVMEDFDVWNHMSHLKVHWLGVAGREPEQLKKLLLYLIQEQRPKSDDASEYTAGDWSFNGIRVNLIHRRPLPSKVHCVGENWEWDAVTFRSCQIENLCFDVAKRTFVMVPPIDRAPTTSALQRYDLLSNNPDTRVMMGQSIRLGTGTPWFPNLTSSSSTSVVEKFYELAESNLIWLPYFPEQPNANNPGHLLWDYWLPLYTLVDMFGFSENADTQLFLTNLDKWCVSYAPSPCYNITTKFLSLLGVKPSTFYNGYNPKLQLGGTEPESSLVCASRGLAGIGMLTDHGYKKHGQLIDDYGKSWNVGRGFDFWNFRKFMLQNMHMNDQTEFRAPYKITISINSSNNPSRRRDFQKQVDLLTGLFDDDIVTVQTVVLGKLPLEQQISIVKESAVFISVIGGSASTAMFMERNTCLILFYNDIDDFVKGAPTPTMPNMMDWDFWNNASYLRIHWLPIQSMDHGRDLSVFRRLLENEVHSLPHYLRSTGR